MCVCVCVRECVQSYEQKTTFSILPSAVPVAADPVDDYVSLEMRKHHIPGLSLAILRDGKLIKSVQNERQITFKHLPPGECQLRAIIDKNKNGAWDPGNIQNAEEPENVVFYRTVEQKLLFPIRANWELGPLIIKF